MHRRAVLAGIGLLPFVASCGRGSGAPFSRATDGHLIALDHNLKELWRVQPGGVNMTMAAVHDDRAVVHFGDGMLRGFDLVTGTSAWEWNPGLTGLRYEPPASREDLVFTFNPSGHVLALRISDGSTAWEHQTEAGASALVVGGDQVLLSGFANGRPAITALDPATGEVSWSQQLPPTATLIARADAAFLVNEDYELIALTAATGESRWRHTIESSYPAGLGTGEGIVVLIDSSPSTPTGYRVFAFQADSGTLLWQHGVGETYLAIPSTPYPVFGHGRLYMFGGERQLMAVDPSSGARIWERKSAQQRDAYSVQLTVAADRLYVANRTNLEVFEPQSGAEVARKSIPSASWRMLATAHEGGVLISAFGRPEPGRD